MSVNDEIFPWESGERHKVLSDIDRYRVHEAFPASVLNAPAPNPAPLAPVIPNIGTLSASLIESDDKLFLIFHASPRSSSREWCLVRVALRKSVLLHPNAMQDGKFLVDFYICHPRDCIFNAINQHYWLEYHPASEVLQPEHQSTAHLIRPTAQSKDYDIAEGLTPFRQ